MEGSGSESIQELKDGLGREEAHSRGQGTASGHGVGLVTRREHRVLPGLREGGLAELGIGVKGWE